MAALSKAHGRTRRPMPNDGLAHLAALLGLHRLDVSGWMRSTDVGLFALTDLRWLELVSTSVTAK
jgi:hypothetical protein